MDFIGANGFEEFVNGKGIWIIIGCLGVAFIVSVIFLVLNIIRAKKIRETQEKEFISGETSRETSTEVEQNLEAVQNLEQINVMKDLKKVNVAKDSKKVNIVKNSEQVNIKDLKPSVKVNTTAIYSITQDEKSKEWIVKKVGATRATKRCATKKEAEELVKKLTK